MSHGHDDFDFEPIRGLPAHLPEGEAILWQGAPARAPLARRLFKVRWIALYFAVLAAWGLVTAVHDGGDLLAAAASVAGLAGLGVAAIGLLQLYAWLIARTSVYTITNRRVVMRVGVALPITFNLPFKQVKGALLKANADGTGDIPLQLREDQKIAYVHLWPHARPWRLGKPEPMLRALPEAGAVAELLADAMTAAAADAAPAADTETERRRKPAGVRPAMAGGQAA